MADFVVDQPTGNQQIALVEKSARPRSVQQAPPYISRAPFYIQNPTLFTLDQWRLVAKEPVCRLCIRHIIREISALELEIYSDFPDRDEGTITYFKQLLTDADDGEGWHAFLSRVLQDAMELPIGGVVEIAPDDLTQMAGGIYHVDGATVYPTYDRNIPFVQINPYDTAQRVYFRRGQIERILLMPRVDLRRRPFQEAPVESAFLSIEALSRMYVYYMKQLGDTPMAGILDLMDMTETEAQDWAVQFREMYEGIDPLKIPILYDHIKPAKFIPMARNPNDMALLENFRRFAELVASAFGLSIGDLRLFEHDRVLAGVEASQRVTARSGIGFYAQQIENFLSEKVLMSNRSGIRAKFKLGMTGESQAEAQLALQRAQLLMIMNGNQPIIKQIDSQKQAKQWKLIDVDMTGLPASPTQQGGPGGMGAQLGAQDNMDSMDQDSQDTSQLADENQSTDQLAGQSLSSLGGDQGGQPYDQNDYSDYYKSLTEKAEAGEKPGHPFRGNQYTEGQTENRIADSDEDEESDAPGKKSKVLPGTLPKGTPVKLPNGIAGEAMGAACSTQSSAESRSNWWTKMLGQPVHALLDAKTHKVWNLVIEGKLPPPNVIAGVKKAAQIKEGASIKMDDGKIGIFSGAKEFTQAAADKQAVFMTKDSGFQHVPYKLGNVYLILKLGGKASFHEQQHGTKEAYEWPKEGTVLGAGGKPTTAPLSAIMDTVQESTSFKTRPHPGDFVHHEGVIYHAEAKKTGNPIPAIFGQKKNAEAKAQEMADVSGKKHGVYPINMTANGLQWLPALVVATGKPKEGYVAPAPTPEKQTVGDQLLGVSDITSDAQVKEGGLIKGPSYLYKVQSDLLYTDHADSQMQAHNVSKKLGEQVFSVLLPNLNKWMVATKLGVPTQPIKVTKEPAKLEPPKILATGSQALTEPPKVGDKVTLTDGSVVEMVSFPSTASGSVDGVGTYYWQEGSAFTKTNSLTSSTGVQHLPFTAKAPPNSQNTLMAWYVGKLVTPGLNTPATPTQLPVTEQENPFPTSGGYTAKKHTYKEAKPIVIPPAPALDMPTRPAIEAWKNDTSGFPDDFSELKFSKKMGGETGTAMYQDSKGNKYIVKKGKSAAHVQGEALANEVYRQAGVAVPDGKIYTSGGSSYLVSRYIDGKLLKDMTGAERQKGYLAVQRAFAADALLANWDVVGTGPGHEYDNILIDKAGTAYRVDNGGALDFSGLGLPNSSKLGNSPEDLWSLRDPEVNEVSATAFANMGWGDIGNQMQDIGSRKEAILAAVKGTAYEERIGSRVEMMDHLAKLSQPMLSDHYNADYVENICHSDVKLKTVGIVDGLPGVLQPPNGPNGSGNYDTFGWKDENGKEWDDLRGSYHNKTNLMARFTQFVDDNGGSSKFLETWFGSQAGSSWGSTASAMQYYMSTKSSMPQSSFYWKGGANNAKESYEAAIKKFGKAEVDKSVEMYHAFVYNILSRISFPNNDPETHTVKVYRTEASHVLSKEIDMSQQQIDGFKYKRAPISSVSIAKPAWLGNSLTVQHVPWHDIVGVYFHSRNGNDNTCAFYGDGENEFLALLNDNPATYYNKEY